MGGRGLVLVLGVSTVGIRFSTLTLWPERNISRRTSSLAPSSSSSAPSSPSSIGLLLGSFCCGRGIWVGRLQSDSY